MIKRKHILMTATLAGLATLLAVQLWEPSSLRSKYKDQPELYILPQILTLDKAAPSKTNLSINGYSIAIPWNNCTQDHTFTNNTTGGSYVCQEGQKFTVLIFNKAQNINAFQAYRQVLATSPNDFRAFQSKDKIKKIVNLLQKKSSFNIFSYNIIYEFKTPEFYGFQTGNPVMDSYIEINAFNKTGNHLNLFLPNGEKSGHQLTQKDLNCIIQSLKKESEENK